MRIFLISLIFFGYYLNAQIVFYNVENLFDPKDDPHTWDNEFTPNGTKRWTNYKFWNKIKKTAKVLKIIGKQKAPEIIGLCEIENRFVIEKLIVNPALKKYNYGIIHRDSNDRRGIDVALLYQKKMFKPLYQNWFKISFENKLIRTRDILYAKGILNKKDTLHFFVNHFPSRWGGKEKSQYKRIRVAQVLRSKIDSIKEQNTNAKILIMGDLNDESQDISILNTLGAKPFSQNNNSFLINMSSTMNGKGTHKYRRHWSKIDHIIVSKNFLPLIKNQKAYIFDKAFLFENDKKYLGIKPKRTFLGGRYNKGFSDHLPIYIELK